MTWGLWQTSCLRGLTAGMTGMSCRVQLKCNFGMRVGEQRHGCPLTVSRHLPNLGTHVAHASEAHETKLFSVAMCSVTAFDHKGELTGPVPLDRTPMHWGQVDRGERHVQRPCFNDKS